jgi:hypothetical protein
MEDRKGRFDDDADVRPKIEEVVKKLFSSTSLFDGVHVFVSNADVPDDSALRLVILPPEQWFMKGADLGRAAEDAVISHLYQHGSQPRHRANRLIFIAPDQGILGRLKDATRTALAWKSIINEVGEKRLNIDEAQRTVAENEARSADAVLPRTARECFKWMLCPTQDDPSAKRPDIEAFMLNTSSGTAVGELERVCRENELVIETWSPIHLRSRLKEFYWKEDRPAVAAKAVWEDMQRYLYLPRLKSRDVLGCVIRTGSASRDFFGTAYGQSDGKYDGFVFGGGVVDYNDTLLLISPEESARYDTALNAAASVPAPTASTEVQSAARPATGSHGPVATPYPQSAVPVATRPRSFRGSVEVSPALAKSRLNTISEEIISLLASDPNARLRITLEIDAEYPNGASDVIKRSVSENSKTLGFTTRDWEE